MLASFSFVRHPLFVLHSTVKNVDHRLFVSHASFHLKLNAQGMQFSVLADLFSAATGIAFNSVSIRMAVERLTELSARSCSPTLSPWMMVHGLHVMFGCFEH